MKKFSRSITQVFFWVVVWIIIMINQSDYLDFLIKNTPIFIFQIVLIFLTIYFLTPKLFLNQKYLKLAIILISFIALFSYSSAELIRVFSQGLPDFPKPRIDFNGRMPPRRPPAAFFIHILLLSITFVLSIAIEIFLIAKTKEEALIISKAEALENELKLLKSQINPHFLFNTLNNIYALSAIDTEKTQKGISYLSDMLRYVLYECERPLVAIEKEISYITNYINLFELKSNKSYPIKTDFNIANKNFKIAPMLLIPFLENAFKHSNIEQVKKSFINITINSLNDNVYFSIENSKPFTPHISTDKAGGIGIKNVKKRLAILYSKNHTLDIIDNDTIFKIILVLKNN